MSEDFDDESFYDLYHEKIEHIPLINYKSIAGRLYS